MSLLMDALKRAESSKQAAARQLTGRGAAGNAAPLTLEPKAAYAPHSRALPDLAQHIDSLNADLAAGASSSKPAAQPATAPQNQALTQTEEDNRAAIRHVFAAKAVNPPSRTPLWLALGALCLAALAMGAYVWLEVQNINQGALGLRRPELGKAAPSAAMPAAAPAPVTPYSAPAAPPDPVFAPNKPLTATLAQAAPPPINTPTNTLRTPTKMASQPLAERATDAAAPRIRLTRSQAEADPSVLRAYAHLQASSINQARDDYEAALRHDPNNIDALLGLAVVAQRQGRSADAEAYQRRALEADPQDPHAQAAALAPNNDPLVTESRLKSLLDAQPEAAPLHFALGNLYARQNRWNDAQAHYFNAVAGDADNPDYLFNLAVSLDQLRQGRLAAQHYRLALEASERRTSAFDRQSTIRRLDQLPP